MKILGLVIVMIAVLASCGGKEKKTGGSSSKTDIAVFYYQDSIPGSFKFYKDESTDLEIEMRDYQEIVMKLQNEGQQKVNNLQLQQQAGALSQIQVAKKNRAIEAIRKKIDILQKTDGADLDKKNVAFTEELIEKMEAYAKEYSDKNGYTMLFARQRGGQILYMPESKNVTVDFIKYMNDQENK
ncbi:MAG: OmpH family outer membrane protein [Crocinitomicaceae bacterium]|nr:OmpH family outer membrane protein [Flavobacteriales bacterium]NQZ37946.1 OmpH family outer membrane protein [Crocinitomicaceae bacterium]